jgi:hypothetical protein
MNADLEQNMNAVKTVWTAMLPPATVPTDTQLLTWLNNSSHPLSRIFWAVCETSKKYKRLGCTMDTPYLFKFCCRVLNDAAAQEAKKYVPQLQNSNQEATQ